MPKQQLCPDLSLLYLQAVEEPRMDLMDQSVIKKGKEAFASLVASDSALVSRNSSLQAQSSAPQGCSVSQGTLPDGGQ